MSERRLNLTSTIKVTTTERAAWKVAEKELTRLLNEVDERRKPRTKATVNQLFDRDTKVRSLELSTKRTYQGYIKNHIRKRLGNIQVAKVDVETLESFYTELRTCRNHCSGAKFIQHRTRRTHSCDEHKEKPCSPYDPACRHCKRTCKQHTCNGLATATIHQIHWIISGALERATRWKWITSNPARLAEIGPHPCPIPLLPRQ